MAALALLCGARPEAWHGRRRGEPSCRTRGVQAGAAALGSAAWWRTHNTLASEHAQKGHMNAEFTTRWMYGHTCRRVDDLLRALSEEWAYGPVSVFWWWTVPARGHRRLDRRPTRPHAGGRHAHRRRLPHHRPCRPPSSAGWPASGGAPEHGPSPNLWRERVDEEQGEGIPENGTEDGGEGRICQTRVVNSIWTPSPIVPRLRIYASLLFDSPWRETSPLLGVLGRGTLDFVRACLALILVFVVLVDVSVAGDACRASEGRRRLKEPERKQ